MTARLLCRTGEFAGITREVGAATTLGRGSGNDVVVPSPLVSTSHARIVRDDDGYVLEDLGSSNGTRLDGMDVRGRIRLESLHVITLAESIDLIFSHDQTAALEEWERAPEAPPAAPASQRPAGGGTEVMDSSDWGELPELAALDQQADRGATQTPAAAPVEPPTPPVSPPGRGTEVIDGDGWGELPDLKPVEESVEQPVEQPVEEVPFEHRPTEIAPAPEPEPAPSPAPEPTPEPLPQLAVALPGRPLMTFTLKEGDNVIGRAASSDIRIDDPDHQVSRSHAVLRVSSDAITLVDSGSANGTFVDGERIETAVLAAGRSFRLGPHLECTLILR